MEQKIMEDAIKIAVQHDVLAKEVELLNQQIEVYKTLVDSLKSENSTLRQLNDNLSNQIRGI